MNEPFGLAENGSSLLERGASFAGRDPAGRAPYLLYAVFLDGNGACAFEDRVGCTAMAYNCRAGRSDTAFSEPFFHADIPNIQILA